MEYLNGDNRVILKRILAYKLGGAKWIKFIYLRKKMNAK
jgi:hypothetical protein